MRKQNEMSYDDFRREREQIFREAESMERIFWAAVVGIIAGLLYILIK